MPNYLHLNKKKIQELFEKDVFKIVTSNKFVTLERFPSNIQVFNSCFIDDNIDPCTNKVYKKICLVIYAYHNKKKSCANTFHKNTKSQPRYWFLPLCYYLR